MYRRLARRSSHQRHRFRQLRRGFHPLWLPPGHELNVQAVLTGIDNNGNSGAAAFIKSYNTPNIGEPIAVAGRPTVLYLGANLNASAITFRVEAYGGATASGAGLVFVWDQIQS